ncbi:Oidioi.mRNA.OKI2018_I69.XSR.g14664.t1.cds [Oikopleura dioica]|uniref:Oidioi.mRNA.OKI2018_I69.XSR.g14664.t1.cds n=1 Tax=Oikopleura dioica TaxID=34765 RepID=A0ABN7SAH1_OIKDI|nr:Oidioi.mRNA.OKI2018_I69.XSR.g14664.t1.cds [Oikopleura dioica]
MMPIKYFFALSMLGGVFADRSYQNRLFNNLYLRHQAKEKNAENVGQDEIIRQILNSPNLSDSVNNDNLISYLLESSPETHQRRTRNHYRAKRYQKFMAYHKNL